MPNPAATPKTDFKKSLDSYRAKAGEFRILEVPPLQYLMIDGSGNPNTSPDYTNAMAALYPLAFTLKFASKTRLERDYVVPPLEGLWWADDMNSFMTGNKDEWRWTMMIMAPDWITKDEFDSAVAGVAAKPDAPAALEKVRLETLDEGLCVQTLHVGSYDDEGPVLTQMHNEFIPEQGLRMTGLHHEIYLGDPRKVAPEKLRTILRQPVERV